MFQVRHTTLYLRSGRRTEMFLSRVEINPYRRDTASVLSDPQRIHAAVMASFPALSPGSDTDRVLWRVDRLDPSTYIIVQSSRRPNFGHIVEQFGWPESGQKWDTLEYDDFLSKIKAGQCWRFRIVANPVRSESRHDGTRGKIRPCLSVEDQLMWLSSRSEKLGFTLASEGTGFTVVSRENLSFKHGNSRISLVRASYEGVLEVTDPDAFRSALISGIGRGKAYGCGLLTLAR